MAEKVLNTRIQNRIDTLENWLAAETAAGSTGLILKKGEIALVTVSEKDVNGFPTGIPSVLIKVGDGVHSFSSLEYSYAKAADVHAWAKAANKPTYQASEIEGLDTFINGEIQDTNTTYKLEKDTSNPRILKLSAQEKGATTWTVVSEIELENCSALISQAINALDATVNSADVEEGKGLKITVTETDGKLTAVSVAGNYDNAYDAKGAAEAAISHADTEIGKTNANVTANANSITAINTALDGKASTAALTEETNRAKEAEAKALEDAKKYTDEVKSAILGDGIKETFDTLVEIQTWIEGDGVNATELTTAIADEAKLRSDADAGFETRIAALEGIDHATKTDVATAKSEAISEATTKANQALADAKSYTDTEVGKVATVANTAVQTVTTSAGLTATRGEGSNTVNIAIDDTTTFVFNCGNAAGNPIV